MWWLPKRLCSDGSRCHTGTAGLIWLISRRTTSNQAPHPAPLTPLAPWDTFIHTLTQHCNSPKCLHQAHRWSSGGLRLRPTRAAPHTDSHDKCGMMIGCSYAVICDSTTNDLDIATSCSLLRKLSFQSSCSFMREKHLRHFCLCCFFYILLEIICLGSH